MPGILPDPPSYLCEALYRVHPSLRLAWVGREGSSQEPGDGGVFALVRLEKIRDVGTPEQPYGWGTFFAEADYPGAIYSRHGVPDRRDWDPLFVIPMYHMDIVPAFGFCTRDVYNGRLYQAFTYNLQTNKKVVAKERYEAVKEEGAQAESSFNDMMGNLSQDLWKESMKTGYTSPNVTKEDIKKNLPAHYKKFKSGRGFDFKRWTLWRKGLISNKDYVTGASV